MMACHINKAETKPNRTEPNLTELKCVQAKMLRKTPHSHLTQIWPLHMAAMGNMAQVAT